MNRLVFEDDDVIQRALMMDSDSNDCILIDTVPISSNENIKKSITKQSETQNVLETKVDEEFTNKEMEKKQESEDIHQCEKCSQEFKKEEFENHDCAKKKRKSLVLSFNISQSRTSSQSAKNIRKSDIKNDTVKSDKRKSVNSNTSEKNCKDNGNKSSKLDQNNRVCNEKEQSFDINQSKTPIFYECGVCRQHFNKKELDLHVCRDNSPCLTLTFPKRSIFNASIGKIAKNTSKTAKKSISFEACPRTDEKTVNHKEKAQIKHIKDDGITLSTKSKQQITSQHFANEKVSKKHIESITLENENQNTILSRKSIKRKPDSAKNPESNELKPKNRKIDKPISVDVNKIVAIKTPDQKSTTNNTDKVSEQKYSSKNDNSCQSKTIDPKSITQIEKPIVRNETSKVQHNQVRTSNEILINKIRKSERLHKIHNNLKQNASNKGITKSEDSAKDVTKSQYIERETVKNSISYKLRKCNKISPQSVDETSEFDENSSKNVNKNVRISEQAIVEKDKEGTCQNSINKEDGETNNVISNNQKEASDKYSKRDKIYTEIAETVDSETYKMFLMNELNKILEKERKNNSDLKNNEANAVTARSQHKDTTKNGSCNNGQEADRKIVKKSDEIPNQDEKTSKNIISTKYKLFRLNEHKVLLKKDKDSTGNQNSESREAILVPRKEQECVNENSKNEQEKEDTGHLKNMEVKVVTTQNEQKVTTENENSNNQKESKEIVMKPQSEERKMIQNFYESLKQDEISKSTGRISKRNKKSLKNVYKNVFTDKYKLFRLNELKLLLEKDKDSTGNQNSESREAKQEHNNENGIFNNQQDKEGDPNFGNIKADLSLNNKNIGNEQEKSIKIEFNQAVKTETEEVKKNKRQKRYKCQICNAKYTKMKYRKHSCENKVKKIKDERKNLKIDSQNKVNITILSREDVKVVTVSNNAKDYEVNQGDISNYVRSDPMPKQNDIKETSKENLTNKIFTKKSSIESVSQRLRNIAEEKAIEKEKLTLNEPVKSKPITDHKNSGKQHSSQQNDDPKTIVGKSLTEDKAVDSEIISKESTCKGNLKIQENITTPIEPKKENKDEKDDEIQLANNLQGNLNLKEIKQTMLSENIDHNNTTTGVENNVSKNTVELEFIGPTQNIEHNYSVSEKTISTDEIDEMNTKTTKNDTILPENNTDRNEVNEPITTEIKITGTENNSNVINTNKYSNTSSENKEISTKYEENQLLESTKVENNMKNNLGNKNKVNVPKISTERIRFIEIIDMFVCTRCSQEFSENDIKKHVCSKNTEIICLDKLPQIEKPDHSAEKVVVDLTANIESDITGPEIMESEVIPESLRRKTIESESENIIPEIEITVPESGIIIPDSKTTLQEREIIILDSETTLQESEIIILDSEITTPEIVETTELIQNENTTLIPDIVIENLNQIEGIVRETVISNENVANEVVITTQSEEFQNLELTLEDNKIENVAQKIIILPAPTEEISIEKTEIVSAVVEQPVATASQIENNSFISKENVEQEVIITPQNIETDAISNKNVDNEIVVLTERVVSKDNIFEYNKRARAILIKNVKHSITNDITKNRESNTKILTENIEHQNEKVSVESLENQVFVSKYFEAIDLNKDVQIEDSFNKNDKAIYLIKDVESNETYVSKLDETSISTQAKASVKARDLDNNPQDQTTDEINDTSKSIENVNISLENIENTVRYVTEADHDETTVSMNNNKNDGFIPNEGTTSAEKEECALASESQGIDKITPTSDEIETIIIISSENENKKNIVLTQNEKNETVIIITKQKENIPGDKNTKQSKIKEITKENHQIEHQNQLKIPSLTEKGEVKTKTKYKCPKCLKTFIEDELKTHNCTEKGKDNIKENKTDEKIGVKEKEEDELSIETQLAAILNQSDSQNKLSETLEHSSNYVKPKSDKNKEEKEENALETQLAAILNQNESQNNMAGQQNNSEIYFVKNIRQDHTYVENNENKGSQLTNNQLLDILSKNIEDAELVESSNQDATQKQDSAKTKCFRCSKDFTDRELTIHNCLEYEEKATSNSEIETTTTILENYTKKSRETDQNSVDIEKNKTEVTKSKQNDDIVENNILCVIQVKENGNSENKLCTNDKIPEPKTIRCYNCSEIYDKTHKCSNIEKGTENNDISLEKTDKNKQDESQLEDSEYKKKNKYYFDKYIIKRNDKYECKICKNQYTARKNLVRHIHQHEKGSKDRFECSFCEKKLQSKQSLLLHEAGHTGVKYDCNICDKSFSRKSNLHTHIKLHNYETFSCDYCGKDYSTKRYLLNHPCFNSKLYSCDFCDKKYRQKFNLIDHLHTHVGIKPYKCEFCDEKIASRTKYMTHIENCTEAKIKRESLMKNENKNDQFTCKICFKTLPSKPQLKKHEWKHENKHFICNICPKTFKSKHYLQLHLASHNELGLKRQKYDCPDCDKEFSTKFGLKLHLNIHNGVKFSCPLCEKQFSTKLLLKTHEKTHTGETPYKCKLCNKGFNNRSNLNQHTKRKVCLFRPIIM